MGTFSLGETNRSGLRIFAFTLLPAFLAAGPGLMLQSPWYDELYTLAQAQLGPPWVGMRSSMQYHVAPLYPILAWFASFGGESLFGARLLSLFAFMASAHLFYLGLRRVVDESTAKWTALAYGLHPLVVWHGQDARMYALFLFFAALTFWTARLAFDTGARKWLAWTAAGVFLGAMTHIYFLIFAFAVFVHCFIAEPRERRVRTAAAIAGGVIFSLPVIVWMLLIVEDHPGVFRGAGLHELGYAALTMSAGYAIGLSRAELHYPDALERMMGELPVVVPIMAAFWIPVLAGTFLMWRRTPKVFYQLAPIPLICVLAPYTAALLTGSVSFNIRYILAAVPFVLAGAAFLFVHGGRRWRWLACGVLVAQGAGLFNHYFAERYFNEDYRGLGKYLNAELEPEDRVYAPVSSLVEQVVDDRDEIGVIRQGNLWDTFEEPGRNFYVLNRLWISDPTREIRDALEAQPSVEHVSFRGFEVYVLGGP